MGSFRCSSFGSIYNYALKHKVIFPLCTSRHRSFLNSGLRIRSPKRQLSNLPKLVLDRGRKQLADEFPNPKTIFQNVITEAFLVSQSHDLNPNLSFEQVFSDGSVQHQWKASLSVTWPVKFSVEAIAGKKADVEKMVYSLACKKFKDFGLLDPENLPVLPKSQVTLDDHELKQSKGRLGNIYEVIWRRLGNRDLIPKYNTSEVKGLFENKYWKSELHLKYPAAVSFEGVGKRLHFAENVAAAKALHWLYEKGVINKKFLPILFSKQEEKEMLDNQKTPYPIIIPHNLQMEMKEVLDHFQGVEAHIDEVDKTAIEECFQTTKVSVLCDDFSGSENENDAILDRLESVGDKTSPEWDIITENPVQDYSVDELRTRNQTMFDKYTEWHARGDSKTRKILQSQEELPIFNKKEEILRLISENQVLVLSGETGSGKTTQVPQYILDSYIKEMRGSDCNIIVTQPRRISAISIAARVAGERGEKVGETVGHQVRFDKNLPKGKGALLFCSTGILLRKLCLNPNLDGVSHIIVDEVHERNVQIDFLLILLKNILRTNKNIKVILMSATFNFEIFSQYFDGCPIIKVPGFIYPVKQLFLDDISKSVGHNCNDFLEPKLNVELISSTVRYIHKSQPAGAILCFLPGWNEIKDVANKLHDALQSDGPDYVIYPAHSRLSHDKQKRIFNRPPEGVRKIILATNIAETSITINDVVYVVDSGFQKETSFCARKGTAALGTQWISKANVLQRRGRAGRVKPGVCYHLYPKEVFESMEDYPTPEILRMPLENVILDCKLYCPDMTAEDFLSLAVQPPLRNSIQHGVKELQMLEIMDENENLTLLGKSIINFTSHPRLSKALVLGAFLRCLDPVLTVCAFLTLSRDAFTSNLDDKEETRKIKEEHDQGLCSDHIAMYNMYSLWPGSRSEETTSDFAVEHKLDEDSLIFVKRLKDLFAEHLFEAGLLDDKHSFLNPEAKCNENSSNMNIVYSALCSSFYPNIIKLTQGEKRRGRLRKDAVICSTMRGPKARISKESVAYQQNHLSSPWFIYFSALQSDARMALLAQEVSLVPGICLLLFAGRQLLISHNEMHQGGEDRDPSTAVLQVDDFTKLNFCCSPPEKELLMEWRDCIKKILYLQLSSPETSSSWLSTFHEKYVPTLKRILCTDQAPFICGKKFYLEDNRLIAEDVD